MNTATVYLLPECELDLETAANAIAWQIPWIERDEDVAHPEVHAVAYVHFKLEDWQLTISFEEGPDIETEVWEVTRRYLQNHPAQRTFARCNRRILLRTSWDPHKRLVPRFREVVSYLEIFDHIFIWDDSTIVYP